MADALQTPAHIVPEWYFLPYYAILRAFTADWFVYNILSLGGFLMTAKLMGVYCLPPSSFFVLAGSMVRRLKALGSVPCSMFVWILYWTVSS